MSAILPSEKNEDRVREKFHALLQKTNKERPCPSDIRALKKLLFNEKSLKLWSTVIGMGELAESQALDTILSGSGHGMRECWRQRLQSMRADLGYAESPALERLLIQQVTLCWLNLNLIEYRLTNVMNQSVSLSCGLFWEKRLTSAQNRFIRACGALARVRKLSRNTPILQVNIATEGAPQVNFS